MRHQLPSSARPVDVHRAGRPKTVEPRTASWRDDLCGGHIGSGVAGLLMLEAPIGTTIGAFIDHRRPHMLGSNYPLLNAFWTILYFFIFFLWLMILFRVIWDVFRSHDLGGWGKAGWLLFILVLPFLGVFVYLIARGGSMHERDVRVAQAQSQALRSWMQDGGAGVSTADELAKLADLKEKGVINDNEFDRAKSKLLA
jgi:hypothetical protein